MKLVAFVYFICFCCWYCRVQNQMSQQQKQVLEAIIFDFSFVFADDSSFAFVGSLFAFVGSLLLLLLVEFAVVVGSFGPPWSSPLLSYFFSACTYEPSVVYSSRCRFDGLLCGFTEILYWFENFFMFAFVANGTGNFEVGCCGIPSTLL